MPAARAGVPFASRDREVPNCEFMGTRYDVQQVIDNVRFSRRGAEPRVYLTGRLIAIVQPPASTGHLQEGQFVSVRLTRIRTGGDFPRIDCELVRSAGNQPVAAVPAPVAPANPLQALSADLENAVTAEALAPFSSRFLKLKIRFPREVAPLIEQWLGKAAGLIGFYCRAVELKGWTQEAHRQCESMLALAHQIEVHFPRVEIRKPKEFPAPFKGDPTTLHAAQWTPAELDQEEALRKLQANPFYSNHSLDDLLAACQMPAGADGVKEWLGYLLADASGQALLRHYPQWDGVPGALPVLTAYFQAVLARTGG